MRQIPQNHIHTRSTPFWNKETAPAGIFERHLDKGTRPGVYPRLSVMQGAVKYLGYADEHCSEPEEIMVINAGEFGVFPPEKCTDGRGDLTKSHSCRERIIMGKATYTVTVTNNSNGVSVDYETEAPMTLLVPEVAAESFWGSLVR